MTDVAPVERTDLSDSALYETEDPEAVYACLRRSGPLWLNESADGTRFWAVLRHAEITRAYGDAQSFSSVNGIKLGSDSAAVGRAAQRMLIVSDPPVHSGVRRLISRTMTPAVLRGITEALRQDVADVLDRVLPLPEFDFVAEVARRIPETVICELLGVPPPDRAELVELTTRAFESTDEAERRTANSEIFLYFDDMVADRRRRAAAGDPVFDVVGMLAAQPVEAEDIVLNLSGLLFGGNETTRHVLSGGLLALHRFPEQFAALAADESLIHTAVEELLRWTTPAVYVLRTVTRPTELGGVHLSPGDQVALWNASGNRDESVFADPDELVLGRTPNRHLTLGQGRHTCVGARLARLEIATFLSELRHRVRAVELTGTPEWNASNFPRGLRRLPLRLITR